MTDEEALEYFESLPVSEQLRLCYLFAYPKEKCEAIALNLPFKPRGGKRFGPDPEERKFHTAVAILQARERT